jgi:hypothetical protein
MCDKTSQTDSSCTTPPIVLLFQEEYYDLNHISDRYRPILLVSFGARHGTDVLAAWRDGRKTPVFARPTHLRYTAVP